MFGTFKRALLLLAILAGDVWLCRRAGALGETIVAASQEHWFIDDLGNNWLCLIKLDVYGIILLLQGTLVLKSLEWFLDRVE